MTIAHRDEARFKAISERLAAHRQALESVHIRDLFAEDEQRFARFSCCLDDLLFDYSKNRITAQTLSLLRELADAAGVKAWRDAMFAGEAINNTENRAALHVALRNRSGHEMRVDGEDVMAAIDDTLERMAEFAIGIRLGDIAGARGKPFTDIVNMGIGGSDLGPAMVVEGLSPYGRADLRCHFVSNVDGAHIADTLRDLDPATTLFIVASKSFTTIETLTNAHTARRWLVEAFGERAVARHFCAVSTASDKVRAFGIETQRMFIFWDWVGGRTSLWSAIGLSAMIAVGPENFARLLDGAHAVDTHFRTTPMQKNIPVIMALLSIWYRNHWDMRSHAILPYDQRLNRLPAYLQQLVMESNGKGVLRDGRPAPWATSPVVWGACGTNAQHAFMQQLHQGDQIIPCDFLVAANPIDAPAMRSGSHHALLVAHCLAQSEALALGRSEEAVRAGLHAASMDAARIDRLAPHRTFSGNRPSNTFIYKRLDPYTLGRLIALYEHKTFVEGILWGINSFDQWGVELGKELAGSTLQALQGGALAENALSSTAGLLAHARAWREKDGADTA